VCVCVCVCVVLIRNEKFNKLFLKELVALVRLTCQVIIEQFREELDSYV
jgi:hypothetical protein